MATPTRIVVYFDDGTQTEIPVDGMSSVFLRENAAVKCGHRPPYKKGPPPNGSTGSDSTISTMSLMSTTDDGGDNGGDDSRSGTSCYYINGVIVCP
jgi:hypothetical protein